MGIWLYNLHFGSRNSGTVKLHSHDFWQLEIVTKGVIRNLLRGEALTLEAGDLLLIPPGWEHEFTYDQPGASWITFKFGRDGECFGQGGRIGGTPFTDRLVAAFRTAIRSSTLKDYESVYVCGFLETVFHYLHSDDYRGTGKPPHPLLHQITEKVRSRNGRAITVNELAEALSYTRSHLSKKFKQLTGENLKTYIDKLRMEKVQEMLRYSEFSIPELAADLGFSDIYSFSRFVKKHTGVSPRRFQ